MRYNKRYIEKLRKRIDKKGEIPQCYLYKYYNVEYLPQDIQKYILKFTGYQKRECIKELESIIDDFIGIYNDEILNESSFLEDIFSDVCLYTMRQIIIFA